MFCRLFNQRNQDQTDKVVRHASLPDGRDVLDQKDSRNGDQCQCNDRRDKTLNQSQLRPPSLSVSIFVLILVVLEHFIENTVMGT
jgi:hypothetical protein